MNGQSNASSSVCPLLFIISLLILLSKIKYCFELCRQTDMSTGVEDRAECLLARLAVPCQPYTWTRGCTHGCMQH